MVQAWQFVWDYPGMLLATAGTALLLLVVVTSVRKARKRLRYESWHLLHLYGYLGVGLAIPHMLWTGADFTVSPAATVYWWAMGVVTVATVVVFRLGLPLTKSLRHGIGGSAPSNATARAASGAHDRAPDRRAEGPRRTVLHLALPDGAGWTRGHPFSLATDPADGELVISARFVGDGTQRLAALRPGTRVLVEGPYGTMTADERRGGHLLMIGAGAGVAPLVAMLEEADWAPGEATLIVRDHTRRRRPARRRDRPPRAGARPASRAAARPSRTDHLVVAADLSRAVGGGDLIRYVSPRPADTDVFLCGPPAVDGCRARRPPPRRGPRRARPPRSLHRLRRFR